MNFTVTKIVFQTCIALTTLIVAINTTFWFMDSESLKDTILANAIAFSVLFFYSCVVTAMVGAFEFIVRKIKNGNN